MKRRKVAIGVGKGKMRKRRKVCGCMGAMGNNESYKGFKPCQVEKQHIGGRMVRPLHMVSPMGAL